MKRRTHPVLSACRNLLLLLPVLGFLMGGCATGMPFQTHDAESYHEILSGQYRERPVTVHGKLVLSEGTVGKLPAVIIVPGSGGAVPWMDSYFAESLHRAGIATFRVDSFSGRGVRETATDQGRISSPSSVLDGFSAFRFLASHPRIDVTRIGITGFSRGGTVALYTAEKRLSEILLPPGARFAAHVPFYPGCATYWKNPDPTSAPILVLLGGKDDYTGTRQCMAAVERMRARGANIEVIVYPNAHHGWVTDVPLRHINVPTFQNCNSRIRDDGLFEDVKTEIVSREGWREGVRRAMRTCAQRGATYGANPAARGQSLEDMVRFFKSSFELP